MVATTESLLSLARRAHRRIRRGLNGDFYLVVCVLVKYYGPQQGLETVNMLWDSSNPQGFVNRAISEFEVVLKELELRNGNARSG